MPVQQEDQTATSMLESSCCARHLETGSRCSFQLRSKRFTLVKHRMKNALPKEGVFGEILEATVQFPVEPSLHISLNGTGGKRRDSSFKRDVNLASRIWTNSCTKLAKAVKGNNIPNTEDMTEVDALNTDANLMFKNCNSVKSLSPLSAKVDQWLEASSDSLNHGHIKSPSNGSILPKSSIGSFVLNSFRSFGSCSEARDPALYGNCRQTQHDDVVSSVSSDECLSQRSSFSTRPNRDSSSVKTVPAKSASNSRRSSVQSVHCADVQNAENSRLDFGEIPTNEQNFIDSEIFLRLGREKEAEFPCGAPQGKLDSKEGVNLPPAEHNGWNPINIFHHNGVNDQPVTTSRLKERVKNTPLVTKPYDVVVSESRNSEPIYSSADELQTTSSNLQTRLELSVRLEQPSRDTATVIKSPSILNNPITKPKEIKVPENNNAKITLSRETCSSKDTSMRLDRPYRVYLCGGLPLPTVDIVVNKTTMAKSLNRSVLQVLEKSGSVSLATRLQAYMWPVVSRGQNVIAVGERSGGKTTGYIFPLASLLLDMWPCVQQEASVRIGSVAIIICNGWRAVQRVGNEFSRLLAPHKIRVVTAWSGSGSNSLNEIQKEIYRGCDVLVSTLPFLMHLAGIQREEDAETRIQFDLLSYCFHLVFDDADVLLDSRAEDVKIVLREWAVSRSKNQTSHFCQQLIITASSWTKYICELAEFLFPLMEPTLMISSQLEAAKAAGVRSVVNITHCSDDSSQQKILGDVTELVIDGTSEKRIIIFVRHYSDARQLKKLLESRCVFSRVAHGRLHTWQLQEEVKAWRSADAGKILIVSDRVVPLLLQHDIRDAYIIVHTYVPNTKAEFTQRFSFLLDNYSEPFKSSHTAALDAPVCFVMLDDSSSLLPPYLLECLEYLNTDIPLEVKKKFAKCENRDIPLCHYLKAYGSCPSVNLCVWRHKIIEKDLLCQLPQSGIVTVDIVKVLNASRYLVRLNQFRIKVDCAFVDLSENYFTLFMTLQSFCSDESRLTKFVKPGREDNLCLVNYESVWARARILKHRQLPNMVRVPLFLIDEGTEIVVDVSELYELPLEFSNLPQLIVEVYLCKVRPLDDIDWTQNANVFVETIFNEARGGSQFTGTIATSLSHTLWLSPLVEIVKVEGSLIRKESIRSQLIRHEYGAANEEHLDLLERQLQVVKARQNSRTASWLDHWTPNKSKESSEDTEIALRTVGGNIPNGKRQHIGK